MNKVRSYIESMLLVLLMVSCGNKLSMMNENLFKEKRWDKVEKYIDGGGDLDWTSENTGWSLITYLIYHKQENLILKLIENGVSLKAEKPNQKSPLFLAAAIGMNVVVSAILNNPKNNNENDLISAFLTSVEEGHIEVIKVLLSHGVDVNSVHGGLSALYLALYQGNFDVAIYLLDNGADYHFNTSDNTSLLIPAAIGGNLDLVTILVNKGLNVNHKNYAGETPLLAAVSRENNVEVIKFLLSQNADPCRRNNDGHSAYSFSMRAEGDTEIKKIFENYQCD